jgi:hypothetical protein
LVIERQLRDIELNHRGAFRGKNSQRMNKASIEGIGPQGTRESKESCHGFPQYGVKRETIEP